MHRKPLPLCTGRHIPSCVFTGIAQGFHAHTHKSPPTCLKSTQYPSLQCFFFFFTAQEYEHPSCQNCNSSDRGCWLQHSGLLTHCSSCSSRETPPQCLELFPCWRSESGVVAQVFNLVVTPQSKTHAWHIQMYEYSLVWFCGRGPTSGGRGQAKR